MRLPSFMSPIEVVSDKDQILMSPLQKWNKYRAFPLKLFLNIAILTLLLVELYSMTNLYSMYSHKTRESFSNLFLGSYQDGVYGFGSTRDFIADMTHKYYYLNDYILGDFQHLQKDGTIPPILFKLTYLDENFNTFDQFYKLTEEEPFGPLAVMNNATMLLVSQLKTMDFEMQFLSNEPLLSEAKMRILINATIHSEVVASRLTSVLVIDKIMDDPQIFSSQGWMSVLLLFLSGFSSFYTLKHMWRFLKIYQSTKSKYDHIPEAARRAYFQRTHKRPICIQWEDVPLDLKLSFLPSWELFSLLGDICVLLGSGFRISSEFGNCSVVLPRLFIGLGILIICTNLTKYLEYNPTFYTLIVTLKTSFFDILSFVVSASPSFIGYIACGFVVFSPYSAKMANLDFVAVNLFGLLNADNMRAVFEDVNDDSPQEFSWFARFYMISFVLFFFIIAMKIFIIIIEEAYHMAKVTTVDSADNLFDQDDLLLQANLQVVFDLPSIFEVIELTGVELPKQRNSKYLPASLHSKLNTQVTDSSSSSSQGSSSVLSLSQASPVATLLSTSTPQASPGPNSGPPRTPRLPKELLSRRVQATIKNYQDELVKEIEKDVEKLQTEFLEAFWLEVKALYDN
uniref:Polycystin cation channel PKD1/PKD2 domain-containing protein n=1 Tax=Arcella intermedia TaxID=1963864 RepID=A0A6B2KZX4_9EUKA